MSKSKHIKSAKESWLDMIANARNDRMRHADTRHIEAYIYRLDDVDDGQKSACWVFFSSAWAYLEGGRGGRPPNRPPKLSFYHDEGSTGGTSLAAMPSVLETKARRLNFVQ